MTVESLLARNRAWSHRMCCGDAEFFAHLARQQKPAYLWIACSDSRVPSNQILNLAPGKVFTHRNIANVVASSDLNSLSVIQFALDILKVRHIMVVGQYGCSDIRAAFDGAAGPADAPLPYPGDWQQQLTIQEQVGSAKFTFLNPEYCSSHSRGFCRIGGQAACSTMLSTLTEKI